MTELLDQAVLVARDLPPAEQDAIARFILELSGDAHAVIELTPAEELSLAESLDQAERREFATDEQVRSIWAKHGL